MSEVKRYTADAQYPGQYAARCDLVAASDFDAAQAELSALREELELTAKMYGDAAEELQQRLTAAEQRNSELLDLLRDIKDAPGGSQFRKHIDAALKPTEPEYIGLKACVSCSASFGKLKTCSNSLLGNGYYVECASCGAKTAGYDKASSAVKDWNSMTKPTESGASE